MKSKLTVGVIGLGRMGQIYARHLAQIGTVQMACVSDVIEARAQRLADELGLASTADGCPAWTTDYRELLAKPAIQAVFVTSPTSTHQEVVIAAAEEGKAIFCEKPIALTLEDTDRMIAAIDSRDVLFQAGFMRRFDSGYVAAKRQIDAGVIGRPVTFKSIGRDPFCPDLNYARPEVSGGLILDMAIHDFDLGRWLMGDEVRRVYTEGGTLAFPQLNSVGDIDNAVVSMLFAQGALGNVEVSRNALYGYDIRTEILGTQGGLNIGYYQQTPLLTLTTSGIQHDMVPYIIERFGSAYLAQTRDFIERVTAGRPPAVTAQDARKALAVGLAATRSYHEERPVELTELG
jgi:inositol 2-dehydrogenase